MPHRLHLSFGKAQRASFDVVESSGGCFVLGMYLLAARARVLVPQHYSKVNPMSVEHLHFVKSVILTRESNAPYNIGWCPHLFEIGIDRYVFMFENVVEIHKCTWVCS